MQLTNKTFTRNYAVNKTFTRTMQNVYKNYAVESFKSQHA